MPAVNTYPQCEEDTFGGLLLVAVELSLATLYVKVSKFSKKKEQKEGKLF